jgi:hypothetical protein
MKENKGEVGTGNQQKALIKPENKKDLLFPQAGTKFF